MSQPALRGGDPSTSRLSLADWLSIVLLVGGGAATAEGVLMLLVGTGSFFASIGVLALVPWVLALGGSVAAISALSRGRSVMRALAASAPRMFPLAPMWINALLFVAVLVGAVSTFHGIFDVFASAHNGGNVGTIVDQNDLEALLISGSVVIWVLTLYAVLAIGRSIRMGRQVDARLGRDPYGRPLRPLRPDERPRSPARAPPPAPIGSRSLLVTVSVILCVAISAGIQILEVDVGPAPPGLWFAAQSFTPLWAGAIAMGIGVIDRGVREVEIRYVEALRDRPAGAPADGGVTAVVSPSD